MSRKSKSFENFIDELDEQLQDIEDEGYRLRKNLGDTHEWFLQAGGDFNAYIDDRRDPALHKIRDTANWGDKSHQLYRLLDDEYDL